MREKLNSIDHFKALQDRLVSEWDRDVPTIVIPAGTCGRAAGADALIHATQQEITSRKLAGRIRLRITGCHGLCEMEPCVLVEPEGTI